MRVVLKIFGQDLKSFLQGIISQDINITHKDDISTNSSIYSLMLSRQGRFLCDFFIIFINDDEFYIDIDDKHQEVFVNQINKYKLNREVNVSLTDLKVTLSMKASSKGIVILDSRNKNMPYRIISDSNEVIPQIVYEDQYKLMRYKNNLIEGSEIPNNAIAIEYKLLHGISTNKGCYIGQEFTNRSINLMTTQKELMHVQITYDSNGVEIIENDKVILKTVTDGILEEGKYNFLAIVRKNKIKDTVSKSNNTIKICQ